MKKNKKLKYKVIFSILSIGLLSTSATYLTTPAIASEAIDSIDSTEIIVESTTGEILKMTPLNTEISAEITVESTTGKIISIK